MMGCALVLFSNAMWWCGVPLCCSQMRCGDGVRPLRLFSNATITTTETCKLGVLRGIPGNTFFDRKYFMKIWRKNQKLQTLFDEFSSLLSKLLSSCPTEPSYGRIKLSLKRSSSFNKSRVFEVRRNRTSRKRNQQVCQNCVSSVRKDIFTLIFLVFFSILKVSRLWAKVSRTFVRKTSATCQIYNLWVLRKLWRIWISKTFEDIFSCVLKIVSRFDSNFSQNYIFTYPEEQCFLFLKIPVFWIVRAWRERCHTFGPESQQVRKTANDLFRGSFDSNFFVVSSRFFSFQKFCDFERILFLQFWTKKTEAGW